MRSHLQRMFYPQIISKVKDDWVVIEKRKMTWENHGEWHVDHRNPVNSFDLTDSKEQKNCFRYTNLQPLWECDNLAKGDKITKELQAFLDCLVRIRKLNLETYSHTLNKLQI